MKLLIPFFLFFSTPLFGQKIIYIQPLGNVKPQYMDSVKQIVEQFYHFKCIIKPKIEFTKDILNPSKRRYSAERIIEKYNSKDNLLIVTEKDITARKGNNPEWGVIGLGYRPGTTCVISTFRIKNKNLYDRLKKVSLHEIGHNLGLSHCTSNCNCIMGDANGTVKEIDEERYWICPKCKKNLK